MKKNLLISVFVLILLLSLWSQAAGARAYAPGAQEGPITATPRPTRIVTTATLTARAAITRTATATATATATSAVPTQQTNAETTTGTPSDQTPAAAAATPTTAGQIVTGPVTPTPFVNVTPVTVPTQQADRPYRDATLGLWSKPADLAEGANTNWHAFPIPICDQYQNLHVFWVDNQNETSPEGFRAAFYYRDDVNGTLSPPRDVVSSYEYVIHNPGVTIFYQDNTVHLVWVSGPFGSLYHTSAPLEDAGNASAWQRVQYLDNRVFYGAIRADGEHVHIVYGRSTDGTNETQELVHIQSTDGVEWSAPQIIYTRKFSIPTSFRPEMAIDESGRIHVGVTMRSITYGVASEVGYVRSPDGGQTWEAYRPIQTQGKAWQGVEWIAPYAFGKDEVHLTWHDPERMHMVSNDGGVTWSTPDRIVPLGAAFGGADELVKDSNGVLHAIVAVQGGVYLVTQQDGVWGIPEELDDRSIDMHGQRIAVCQGNKIYAFGWDRTGPMTAWYWTRTLDAPAIPRQPIPTRMAQVVQASTAEATPMGTVPTREEDRPVNQQFSPNVETNSMLVPFVISVGSAAIFIAAIVGFLLWRQNR